MLIVIHGSDTTLSRKYFLDEKNKIKDAVSLDADKIDLTYLTQLFKGGGLFGESKHLFIEQFLTKRKKSTDYQNILDYLQKYALENTIILWEGKELDPSTLRIFKNATIKAYKFPQTLFQLLDAIKPENSKSLINLFHQTILHTEAEMIFFMLVRQFRLLLALSHQTSLRGGHDTVPRDNPQEIATLSPKARNEDPIDEIKRMAPWQKTKLQKQASLFELSHLLDLYNKLFQIEVGQKTGTLNSSLIPAIDFFLLSF